jgi:peptide/nickel transport system ATP-binding protein
VADTLLEIRNLRIEAMIYPPGEAPRVAVLVDDVSVAVQKGRVLGLIGESGAGKSTIGLSAMAYGRGGVRLTGCAGARSLTWRNRRRRRSTLRNG